MLVEPARLADVPNLLRLHRDVLAEGRWFVSELAEYPFDVFSLLEHVKRVLADPHSNWLVARDGDALVGFATAIASPVARLRHVVRFEVMVAKSARGSGVGKALTEGIVSWARHNEPTTKLSLAVFDDNERAIALYRSLGFVEEGRRPAEYRERDGQFRGDVLMALDVTE